MARKQYGRRATTIICLKLVETHDSRKKRVKKLKAERASLYGKINSLNITDMPTSHGGDAGDPIFNLYAKMEELEEAINAEQHRIQIVDDAIENIGKNIEKDAEVRRQMQKGILTNIQLGGCEVPFYYTNYPEQYSKDMFYAHRKAFLREIADKLYLS